MERERRLSGPVGSEQGHPFTGVHVEVDAEECLVTSRVGVREAPDVEHREAHQSLAAKVAVSARAAGTSAVAHSRGGPSAATSRGDVR